MAEHWMRYLNSEKCWALFSENGNGTMRVLAHVRQGYIWNYPELPREDARDIWRRLKAMEWHECLPDEVESAGMTTYQLNIICLPAKYKGGRPESPTPNGNGRPSRFAKALGPTSVPVERLPRRRVAVSPSVAERRPSWPRPSATGNDPGPWNSR